MRLKENGRVYVLQLIPPGRNHTSLDVTSPLLSISLSVAMSRRSTYQKLLLRDMASFKGPDILVSPDTMSWAQADNLIVSPEGSILVQDAEGLLSLLLQNIQSCYVQIYLSLVSSGLVHYGRRRFGKKALDFDFQLHDEPPVIFIRTYDNDRLYMKISTKNVFEKLLLTLMAWQNMKPQGLVKKWYAQNKVLNATTSSSDPHELLVCRFKIYGPIPAKAKTVTLVNGPKPPVCFSDEVNGLNGSSPFLGSQDGNVPEGWFYTMGVLKSNGILNFITELDGTLLYSVNIKKLLLSEIRELHNSICDNPNILFIGHIKELRWNNVIKPTSTLTPELLNLQCLLTKDGRPIANNLRILIEFPLHIDLEDWFVGLNYFCKREYIGIHDENSVLVAPSNKRFVDLESTIDPDSSVEGSSRANTSLGSTGMATLADHKPIASLQSTSPDLEQYTRDHFRVSKKVMLDIIEAKFDNVESAIKLKSKVYAEVVMWGYPWARTALVAHSANPFWKEEFSTDLPILTQMIHIVIKKTADHAHSTNDRIVGTVFLTPDILAQQLKRTSTMSVGMPGGEGISLPGLVSITQGLNAAAAAAVAAHNNNIVRLSIYDSNNLVVGKLLLTVDLKEYLIPAPQDFRILENMLLNCPMKELIEFCNSTVTTSEFENVSFILLDIFQSLAVEDKWFKTLMEVELVMVDKVTRKNYGKKNGGATSSSNMFNTLFRGNSIFTKSLEKYILRIGQEYLEKVFGDFFEKIAVQKKNCEIDPRYVRQQEKAARKGRPIDAAGTTSSEEDEESDLDSDEEEEREERIKQVVEENFQNLYGYTEEIWQKIYATSNDLPLQIKNQLKNFRNKVDLACDPDDKVTALNCLSAFIFLRFFCPAILNPKLFYLTKTHQTGQAQRTLTFIAKILLNLANRQEFSAHKEPHLVKMNEFLRKHESEVYDYFDKITGRRNDFNEKVLNLSHEMKRFDLGLSGDSASSELPTTPYLIDKYLRLTEFIHLLHLNTHARMQSQSSKLVSSVSSASINTTLTLSSSIPYNGPQSSSHKHLLPDRQTIVDSSDDIRINEERNVYQIGSLEFEKSEFLDLVGDNETEGFIKSLCRSNEQIFSFITSNITLKDLQKQSTNLVNNINELSLQLQRPEQCRNLQGDSKLWEAFVTNVVSRAYLDTLKNAIVFYDKHFQDSVLPMHKRMIDNGLSFLKLKFPQEYQGGETMLIVESFSSTSISSVSKSNTKNPFKRWLRRD